MTKRTELPVGILQALQARAARSALGPSSMRGAGSQGVLAKGRPLLSRLDLRRFSTRNERRFRTELDRVTRRLLQAFPRKARHWGLARKGLNIFLRDCLYTVYLRDAYSLELAERFYEVPLDSLTGTALCEASGRTLPRWSTVRSLQPEVSERYQEVAATLARHIGVARVHLDAVWWGQRGDAPEL